MAEQLKEVIIREYEPGEIIVEEGAVNDRFFVVLLGNVEIIRKRKCIRVLKDGDVFGIENYFLQRPYSTSAKPTTKARVASYHASMIKEFIYDRPQLVQQIFESVMRQLEQTTQVAEKNISFENVVDIKENIYKDGEVIIKEGSDETEFYRLVEAEKGLMVTKAGKEVGCINQSGEYFGEMSAILKEQRSATVTSMGRSVVQVFNNEDIVSVLKSYPDLSKVIIDTLAKRLNEANIKISKQS